MRVSLHRWLYIAAQLVALAQANTPSLAGVVSTKLVKQRNDVIQPAWVNVSETTSRTSADWFDYETLQLTDGTITELSALDNVNASLFDFAAVGNNISTARRSLSSGQCKTAPGDVDWPSTTVWSLLDLFLGGSLIKTVPLASPCYHDWGNYDADLCALVTANWSDWAYMQTANPVSVNAELYQNSSCLPPGVFPYDTNCTLGSYPPYSVNVSNVAQIQLALNFARNLNLRLVVKNTGHDFNAKSTGAGALAIWTHNLKDTLYYDNFTTNTYSGPAFKLGAGVQGYELYEACHEKGVTCIGGEGRTVGMVGGFTQGGGHSPLSSIYGLGADQVLCFEVVTADGRFVTASEDENEDLFWALRGGGGGTFGVVTSATVKAYPKLPCATLTFTITRTGNVTEAMFWAAAKAYWDGFVTWTNAGTYSYFYMYPAGLAGLTADTWLMMPWFAPNMTQAQLEDLVAPLFSNFSSMGLSVVPTYAEYDNFYDAWNTAFPLEFWGINVGRQAGRFFPYENWANETITTASFEAVKSVFLDGAYIYGFHIAPGSPLVSYPDNAVNPAWRQTVGHIMLGGSWELTDWANEMGIAKIAEVSYNTTNVWGERWRKVAPNSGCYLSESDYLEPDFQTALWGSKYERLYEIKQRYDPWGLFYGRRGVASDEWETDEEILPGLPSQAGKLCRV